MEVKTAGAIPLWMVHFLTENQIYKTSFSKYATAYRTISGNGQGRSPRGAARECRQGMGRRCCTRIFRPARTRTADEAQGAPSCGLHSTGVRRPLKSFFPVRDTW